MNARIAEHRWADRVPVDIPVQLIAPGRIAVAGRMTSFSTCGAFVETDLDARVMTNITLIICDGGHVSMRPSPMAGYVVRRIQGGIALGWWKLAPVTTAHVMLIQQAMQPGARALQPSQLSC